MLTKDEAKIIAKDYIEERERDYTIIKEPYLEEDEKIIFGKYDQQKKMFM